MGLSGQSLRWVIIGGVFSTGLALAVAWWVLRPAPPSKIVLTAGAEGGAYLEYARRYAAILARDGVTVEVRTSPGAAENLRRLRLPSGDPQAADVGFVQSGTSAEDERAGLIGLGYLFFEPAWLFVRRPLGDLSIVDFGGQRINIGPEGSGTRTLALAALRAARIDPLDVQLLDLYPVQAAAELRAGRIDGALFVAKADAPLVLELLGAPEVTAVSWKRADALERRLPEVRKIVVPAGVVDLKGNIPERDLTTIAAQATLVAREDLHPALAFLLVRAAREIHGGPSLLNAAHEFPTIKGLVEFDVPEDVKRLYASGPPFLYRYLPYWLANLCLRLWVLVIPLAAVAAVASDWLPRVLTLRSSMRVDNLYRRVKLVEGRVAAAGGAERPALLAQIDALAAQVDALRVPTTMIRPHYDLRRQLRLLHDDLDRARTRLCATPERGSTTDDKDD